MIGKVSIKLLPDYSIICNGEDVSKAIREPFVSSNVSYIASYKRIRLELVDMQRDMAKSVCVVMDGRDIGTYVLPNADVKIFQIASVETRALRRYQENKAKGIPTRTRTSTKTCGKGTTSIPTGLSPLFARPRTPCRWTPPT